MNNTTLTATINTIRENLELLSDTYNLKIIGIFGSLVCGEYSRTSDIDILVEFSKPISFFKFIELEGYLGRILKKKVNLVSCKALKPPIKENILKEVVYA